MKTNPWAALLLLSASSTLAEEVFTAKISGTITDTDGKPVAGAKVLVNRTQEAEIIDFDKLVTRTDKDGKFEIPIKFKDRPVLVDQIWVEAKGFVKLEHRPRAKLANGDSATLDLKLEKGDVLAGVIKLPPSDLAIQAGEKPEHQRFLFWTDGPKGRLVHWSEKGGRFEIWVPPGEYTIHSVEGFEWKGIKSGKTGLVLEPPPFEWTEANLGAVFNEFWEVVNNQYSYFFLKKELDWKKLKDDYRPRAVKAKNTKELAAVVAEVMDHLRDLHVWVHANGKYVEGKYSNPYMPNWNRKATLAVLEDVTECGKFARVGKVKGDGFGYFLMTRQSEANEQNVAQAIGALEKLRDAPGIIVDLRAANGGNELLAQKIAGLFCAKDTVYAKSKYRNGPNHTDFSKSHDRVLKALPQPYTKPVVCLIGPGCVSSGEGFAQMMKCLPNVTLVGANTRGASGNPAPYVLSRSGVSVWFSRWVDMLPDGTAFEGKGIPADFEVKEPVEAYKDRDPTLEKGLEVLRAKVAAANSKK
jgi:hypothetical protein